ncbi:Bug family tripartite tricarboxylate transporter substrate binding protein [Devosia salina]|uniref:Tripartite tricarboxylate transporter substrate binding protein n=1 Tax=Devosia salina TaxID=2860336 RepID=A0ABX8WJ69_9HYPH|nr:tripartite tricarboxylate transporter substrate binding protein [Devosia salina]QYO78049.1 tripartite tricarboxylate transporter substrate binding protein [Devosia salina]
MNKLLLAALVSSAIAIPAYAADYTIMAPASPGGGWDQTARSMQQALTEEGISGNVQVTNVPGAGGTIGLAQFATQENGNPNALIVGGYVMVGAILTNMSPVTLENVTPIARLIGESDVIVVPANSELQTMDDLVAKLKADPGAVAWAGGSAGGVDHIAAGLIAKAVGVDPTQVNYIAYSGGGEALAAVLGGQVTVGISGYGEFESQIAAGELRALAVTGADEVDGIPTLKESNVDVNVENWRMVAAAPGITDEQKAAITADIEKMASSDTWKSIMETNGWQDMYMSGADFDAQLAKDIESTTAVLKDIGLVQ